MDSFVPMTLEGEKGEGEGRGEGKEERETERNQKETKKNTMNEILHPARKTQTYPT